MDDEADFNGERTPFALTVGDADNIDRFDAYRIHEGLSKENFISMSFDEKTEFVEKRLKRISELAEMPLGTKTAEELWRSRLAFCSEFYGKLAEQLRNSRSIL